MSEFAIKEYITSNDLKRMRKVLNMTQKEFAMLIGASKPTVERWEMKGSEIKGPIVMLVQMLEDYPEYVEKMRIPGKKYPLRLKYMYKQRLCTIIDADISKRKIAIMNFVDNIVFRAFGNNTNPSYEDFEEFLKSRCFPETRDKLKLVLKDLGIPFYDPLLIIEKTEGRMAEDDFWISIQG